MARIGIYGGTFNPIHNTHLGIANAALNQFELDKIFFLVAGDPPHKIADSTINGFMRLDMVKEAIKDNNKLFIDSREIYRSGKSYSYITLQEYAKEYPGDELFFIMGSDSLMNFSSWVKPEVISSYATIISAPRVGDDMAAIGTVLERYNKEFPGSFKSLSYIPNSISSTEIRNNLRMNDSVEDFIPASVYEYIVDHGLYQEVYNYDKVLELSNYMKEELKTGRYTHTLGVANTAYTMALKWQYPAYNAMVAGMLHDCAKCLSDEKRLMICKDNSIEVTQIEKKYPHLLHGKVGAYLAKKKYEITNMDILHSIEVHTTGCINMSLLDKIIFVADYIEPGRNKQPRLDILRKLAYEDLDLCVYLILEDTVMYLSDNPEETDPTTTMTYNYYKELRGK